MYIVNGRCYYNSCGTLKSSAKKFYKNCKKIPSMIRSKHYRLRREKVDVGHRSSRMENGELCTADALHPFQYTGSHSP